MWTPVALSKDLKPGKPLQANYWGVKVVLWRQPDGTAAALRDACGHRGIPLSQGEVVNGGEAIRCGYHHFCFDRKGACVKTPSMLGLGDDYRAGCKVQPYFVKEAFGLLWVSVESEAERPFPMPAPAEGVAYIADILPVKGPFLSWLDHQLDGVHMLFPHGKTVFGVRDEDAVEKLKIESARIDDDWKGVMTVRGSEPSNWVLRFGQAGGFAGLLRGIASLWRSYGFVSFARNLLYIDRSDATLTATASMRAPSFQFLQTDYKSHFGNTRYEISTILNPVDAETTQMAFVIVVPRPLTGILGHLELMALRRHIIKMHITGEDHTFLSTVHETNLREYALTGYDAFVAYNRAHLAAVARKLAPRLPRESILHGIAADLGLRAGANEVVRPSHDLARDASLQGPSRQGASREPVRLAVVTSSTNPESLEHRGSDISPS